MPSRLDYRPLSPEELAGLQRPARWFRLRALPAALLRFVLYFLVVWLALAVAGGLLETFLRSRRYTPDLPEWTAWSVAFLIWGLAVLIPTRMAWRAWKRRTHADRMRQRDLREARAQVLNLEDADFVALPGLLGGSFYLYALDDGRSLLLDGTRAGLLCAAQSRTSTRPGDTAAIRFDAAFHDTPDAGMRAPDARSAFPSRHLSVHRLPHSGRLLRLTVDGPTVANPTVPERATLTAGELAPFLLDENCDSALLDRSLSALAPEPALATASPSPPA